MEIKKAKAALQAILFASGEPISLERLALAVEVDKATVDKLIRSLMDDFDGDDSGICIIQLGDNVGAQKLANFLECTPILLQRIKTLCPRARILWVCGWFNSPLTTPPIARFCEEWKLELVDILPARSPESQSYSGAPYETADGSTATVKDTWITHPGDLGMRRIADKILDTLSL